MPATVPAVRDIILKSIGSRSMKLQIRCGHASRVPGSNVKDYTSPFYVEFSNYLGRIRPSDMQRRMECKNRDEALAKVRQHVSYGTTFVVWDDDVTPEDKKLVEDLEKQRAAKEARLRSRRGE